MIHDWWFDDKICLVMFIEKATGKSIHYPRNITQGVYCGDGQVNCCHFCKISPCSRAEEYKMKKKGCSATWGDSWETCPCRFSMDELNQLLKQGLSLQRIYDSHIELRIKLDKKRIRNMDKVC